MIRTYEMTPKTKFGRWLLNKMRECYYTCGDVAKEIGTTRQSVSNHINGTVTPSFVNVIAYCWVFNELDNLNDIWNLTMEEES